jgi:hypothetical protein
MLPRVGVVAEFACLLPIHYGEIHAVPVDVCDLGEAVTTTPEGNSVERGSKVMRCQK